jgi:hypothetical protein
MSNTRQYNRAVEREAAKIERYEITGHGKKVGPGPLLKWLQRNPKLAPYYRGAAAMLSTGPRSTPPRWRAVRKMILVLAQAPTIKLPHVGVVPYLAVTERHARGPWRSFPHQTLDANLKVAS